jgi:hypothetical protein
MQCLGRRDEMAGSGVFGPCFRLRVEPATSNHGARLHEPPRSRVRAYRLLTPISAATVIMEKSQQKFDLVCCYRHYGSQEEVRD